jgi:hypothetical protein
VPGVVVAVVATVSVEVAAAVPVMSAEVGLSAHVAGLVAPLGPLTEQVRGTLPVNPLDGVTEMTEVLPVVAPAVTVRADGLAVTVKLGIPFTVTVTAVWEVMLPNVPVVVTV